MGRGEWVLQAQKRIKVQVSENNVRTKTSKPYYEGVICSCEEAHVYYGPV
jgi:hypothetical protein